ncbi:L domain-like protein [Rhizoclosmatium globosum]|uniref:L domain-like protein n=1 Tax=Rhizoclosmatium globosum TaxID=329046 RepID=A0A1Y2B751_9FUNG|nr:L domain-like protein [Rhizoclosmatium globosum]|eukprot:ORY30672.1 L domain-like protein [Rhizoclosmatium globosum]
MLALNDNNISGSIPPQLGQCTELWHLALNNNQLEGPIPPEIFALNKLINLGLNNNQLCGCIRGIGSLKSIQYIGLANNSLRGNLPWSELEALEHLSILYLNDNCLSGRMPREFPAWLRRLQSWSFAGNYLI